MDLGFAGLIEKIEERFGKLITNLLLAALLFLVFSWAIQQIFYIYVSGVTLWNEGGESAIIGLVKMYFIFIIIFILIGIIFWAIVERIQKRAVQKVKMEGEKQKAEFKSYATDMCKELRAYIAEWEKLSGK